jgi:hypothetical protein
MFEGRTPSIDGLLPRVRLLVVILLALPSLFSGSIDRFYEIEMRSSICSFTASVTREVLEIALSRFLSFSSMDYFFGFDGGLSFLAPASNRTGDFFLVFFIASGCLVGNSI